MAYLLRAAVLAVLAASTTSNAELTCAFGRTNSMCYSGRLADCDNSTTTRVECASGCFCPSGLAQFDSELCVEEEQCLDGFSGVIQSVDKCSQYENCDECISKDPDCQWCPFKPDEVSVKGSRCRHRDLNPICPVEINDPIPAVTKLNDADFTDDIQIRPQRIRLKLRAGKPEQFTLQFKPSKNFPLDVYFLLDVTGSFSQSFRETVTPLATELVEALQSISDRYKTGFGGFGDKRATPYSLPSSNALTYQVLNVASQKYESCSNRLIQDINDCNPTISFRHTTSLSPLTTEELKDVLRNISIHLNVDSLEGGMDGLLQVLRCPQVIGWRQQSLRMLLYMSNAKFHLAGDGKLGAAFRPNPGECNLEDREEDGRIFQEYTKDAVYDYPSVYQLRQLIRSTQTNIVFAISDEGSSMSTFRDYMVLEEELDLGPAIQVTRLQQDSSNIVSVIQKSYDDITQEIRLNLDEELSQLDFSFRAGENCTLSDDGMGCSDVALDTTVSLIVTVNMTSCLPNTTVVSLRSAAFGSVELEIDPLCRCPCSQEKESAAEACSGMGTLKCGVCECEEGRSGDQCQCVGETDTCGPPDGEECSGRERGECDCGECTCYIQEELLRTMNITEPYFGEFCQCDHISSCGGISEDGVLCSGRGNCSCEKNTCICTAVGEVTGLPYTGTTCECNPDLCFNAEYPNRTCAHTGGLAGLDDAECGCNTCLCDANDINAVPTGDGTCKPGPDRCTQREQCARCAKDLQSSSTDCEGLREEGCSFVFLTNGSVPVPYVVECAFSAGGCTHTFYLSFTDSVVLVEDGEECDGTGGGLNPLDGTGGGLNPLAWIIPVSVIGGLLVIGILLLLIVLLVIWRLDRYEFNKFQANLEDADWVPRENPIYVSPQQQYTNIAYKRSSRRRQ